MKEVVTRGEGHSRIAKFDEVSFDFRLTQGGHTIIEESLKNTVKLEPEYIDLQPNIFWKLLYSMKLKEKIRVKVIDEVMR